MTLVVEEAISPERTSELASQLYEMSKGSKRERERHQDILWRFAQYAAYGKLDIPKQLRELRGDLWEIKTSEDRVPFYKRSADGHKLAARVMFVFAKSVGKTVDAKAPRWVFDHGEWYMKGDRAIGKIDSPEIASS